MFIGHYGPSFAAKAIDRKIPLWLLFVAVQFIDILWGIFVLLGIEKVRIVPGFTASNALDLYYMPYTHSLLGALGWSIFVFLLSQSVPLLRGMQTGMVLAAAVFSHWFLDLIVHRPDLALYESRFKMGFGLWNYHLPAFALEMAVLLAGAALLLRTATERKGRLAFFIVLLVLVQIMASFRRPVPPTDRAAALSALGSYAVLALIAVWAGREKLQGKASPAAAG